MQDWDISVKEAIAKQKELRTLVRTVPLRKPITTVAGADVSLERFGTELYAGIVLLSYPSLEQLDYAVAKTDAAFPYVPGLLSFREIPGLLLALFKLAHKPDLIVVDGQGIAHPRRLGIAAHLGLETDIATIGCAKSKLYGEFEVPHALGDATPIKDPKSGELLGYALKSKERSNPLIISPGNAISADQSLEVVRSCLRGYRLPEPTRLAHMLVNEFRKGTIG